MPEMSKQLAACVAVGARMSVGQFDALAEDAREAVAAGVGVAALREAAYVGALFCGFPRGVAALMALRPLAAGAVALPAAATRQQAREDGEALFRAIHRSTADRQLTMLQELHPDFAETVLCEAYGRVLARDALPLVVRELIGVASLAVQGLLPQLRAHLLAARNCGAEWDVIGLVLDHGFAITGLDPTGAKSLLGELRRR